MGKLYWNKHKYDRISLDLNSFDSAIIYCLYFKEDSSVHIVDNKNKFYFSPLKLDFNISLVYKNSIREVTTSARLLLSNDYDIFLVLLSYFKDVLNNYDLNHFINFLEKLRFYKTSKSRFVNTVIIEGSDVKIEFKNLNTKLVDIIFN